MWYCYEKKGNNNKQTNRQTDIESRDWEADIL